MYVLFVYERTDACTSYTILLNQPIHVFFMQVLVNNIATLLGVPRGSNSSSIGIDDVFLSQRLNNVDNVNDTPITPLYASGTCSGGPRVCPSVR